LLGAGSLSRQRDDALLERAGGNPLFAEEFVRMLRDGVSLDEAEDLPIPDNLQALVVSRLDALSPELKELVHDASVVGKVFWPGAVAAVGETRREEIEARLPFLARSGLISRRETSSVADEPEFTFRNDVTMDVAYQQIPKSWRAQKHRNAAAWVRMLGGDRVTDLAQEIAFHLSRALELTPRPDPELRDAAAHAQLLAAERLSALDAPAAVRAFRRALALLGRDDPRRPEAFARAGVAADAIGRFDLAEPWLRRAIDAYRAAGEPRRAGEIMGTLGRSLTIQGRLAEADVLFDSAVHQLELLPPGPELAAVCARIAGRAFMAGDYDRAQRWAERTLEVAVDGEPQEAVALALQYRGSVRAERGERAGMDDLREAIRRAREADLTDVLGATLGNLAYLTWFREGPAAALEIAREVQSFAAARGFSVTEMWGKAAEIESCFDLGDWDQVLDLADEMLRWDAEHGPSQIGMWARFASAWVLLRRGDAAGAADAIAEVERGAQLLEYPEFEATLSAIAADIAFANGETAAALARIEDFDKAVADVPEIRIHFLPVVVRTAIACGDLRTAELLVPPTPGPPIERRRLSYETALAVLEEARGELDGAEVRYREVAEGWEAFGFPLEAGRCALGRARCLIALGRDGEADREILRARGHLAPLKARPVLRELDALRDA
jgi:tetratricopeptide (TPR) repeat protein